MQYASVSDWVVNGSPRFYSGMCISVECYTAGRGVGCLQVCFSPFKPFLFYYNGINMFSIQFKVIPLLAGFLISFTGPYSCFDAIYVEWMPLLYFSLLNISLKAAEKVRNMWQV